jgi:hypothetical protein
VTDDDMSLIMNSLFEHRAPGLPPNALAEIFDRMIWCLDDEGAALLRIREAWLTSGDRGRVEVALAMDETFPFADPKKMGEVLGNISAKWPDLALRCRNIQTARARIE